MNKLVIAAVGASILGTAPAAAQTVIRSNNYDTPLYVAPGVTSASGPATTSEVAAVGPWNANGWAGNYYAQRTTGNPATLTFITLGGLAPNSAVTISSGVFGFLESWDSTDGGCCSPDLLDVFINGALVATMTSNNALGTVTNFDGATVLFSGVQVNGNSYYSDTLIDMATAGFASSFADAAGNWSIGFQARGAGWQGGDDEGYGFDNFTIKGFVASGAVPEPATWAMMIGGFGLAGGALRRRRAQRTRVSFA